MLSNHITIETEIMYNVIIYTTDGREIYSEKLNDGTNSILIPQTDHKIYIVKMIDSDCGDTYLITSTEEINSESAEGIIEIFPTPVNGNSFTVLSKVSGRLYLYDMQGAFLHERLITPSEQSCTVKNIPPGTYVAYFTTENGIGYSQRLVFQ